MKSLRSLSNAQKQRHETDLHGSHDGQESQDRITSYNVCYTKLLRTVLLLEAGGPDNYPWIHIPVGYFKTMHNPKYDWCYKTESDTGLAGRQLQWPLV